MHTPTSLPPLDENKKKKQELARLLGPQLSDTLDDSPNKPLWLCNRLSVMFRAIPEKVDQSSGAFIFSSRERLVLMGLVNDLSGIVGACERLVQTPVPLSYARHTSRFLTLYLASLPMVMVADFSGLWLSLVSGFVCWCLFGILGGCVYGYMRCLSLRNPLSFQASKPASTTFISNSRPPPPFFVARLCKRRDRAADRGPLPAHPAHPVDVRHLRLGHPGR